ncbi:MAG: oxidoreductase [Burkholderiales bacterium]|nr:oxidoreductase [Burkholderiales bacterium]
MIDDPRPQRPREPALQECRGDGCTPCVFDRHADALVRYESALEAWKAREAARDAQGSAAGIKAAASGRRRSRPRPARA